MIAAIQANAAWSHTFRYKDIITKGSKIIQMSYMTHQFQDTFLHMAQSLDQLTTAFKVPTKKIKEIGGHKTMDICFVQAKPRPSRVLSVALALRVAIVQALLHG